MTIRLTMWLLERTQGFSNILLSDSFRTDMIHFRTHSRFIKTNIRTKINDNWTKNVAFRAYTSQKVDEAQRTTDTALPQ